MYSNGGDEFEKSPEGVKRATNAKNLGLHNATPRKGKLRFIFLNCGEDEKN
jgi:hypothetical protein